MWPLKRDENRGEESFEEQREAAGNEQTLATAYGGVFVAATMASWCQASETLAAEARQTHPVDCASRCSFWLGCSKDLTYSNYSMHCGLKRLYLANKLPHHAGYVYKGLPHIAALCVKEAVGF